MLQSRYRECLDYYELIHRKSDKQFMSIIKGSCNVVVSFRTFERDFSRSLQVCLVTDQDDGYHLCCLCPLEFESELVGLFEASSVSDGVDQDVGVATLQ